MNEKIFNPKTMIPLVRNSMSRSPLRRGLLLIPLTLALFGLSPAARALLPPPAPDGGYPNGNTAEGASALQNLTTGPFNTALGSVALFKNTAGFQNTATGAGALFNNLLGAHNTANGFVALFGNTADDNTAVGWAALAANTSGGENTANGSGALNSNTQGGDNTAVGFQALFNNTTGFENTATGAFALFHNSTNGVENTANGVRALQNNTTGQFNTAVGWHALAANTMGSLNTAYGNAALLNNTIGSGNLALGIGAGDAITIENNNIDIGHAGVAGDSGTTRIGTAGLNTKTFIAGITGVSEGGTVAVVTINGNGQLGTQLPVVSSRRFKKEIKPMDKASEAILGLKPVTFQLKSDSKGTPQFGLIAEEVAQVNPDLVMRDDKGEIYTVRYEAVNAMLLNEFLKEHRKVQEQEATISELKSTVAQQQEGMKVFAATLKEQDSKIQKVTDQLEVSKPATAVVVNE